MLSLNPQYITDKAGNKVSVVLPIEEYKSIIEELEEAEDIRLYDEAMKEDDGTRINLEDYRLKRKQKDASIHHKIS